ncbi:ATP-binding protein [Sphingomonas sp. BT-65]|uniref:ATP-binding protein n=1 Tax=Sphingomonas sp. BT-65 TaxID=2989821 RepID=UPI002235F340|nr:ATP-binding protein [Sphingomonas sp. BT-65]MCW4463113.1 ATP-binding protein [Sphingomonas sp. BT-65]
MTDERGALRVGAHVLVQLGSELVTDVEQALLECVKNAYDADSPGCRIKIQTEERGHLEESDSSEALYKFRDPAENVTVRFVTEDGSPLQRQPDPPAPIVRRIEYQGRISIEDSGTGISFEDLSRSWLVISASIKRSGNDGPKSKTVLGRTPLGDKGLGRLGTMKLGDILLVESATSPSGEIASAWFRWADCERAQTVDEIPVKLSRTENTTGFKGTRVSVLGLRDLEEWRRKDRLGEVTRSLARLISPFEAASTFPVTVELNEGEQSLALVTEELLARAVADFQFDWQNIDGKPVLIAKARLHRRLLTSQRTRALRERTARVFEEDGGRAFAEYLKSSRRLKGYASKTIDPQTPWFAEIEHIYKGSDLFSKSDHSTQNPGIFSGAFYFFHFVGDEEDQTGAASGTGANLRIVRDLAGIAILRDGFQVRNRGDWLGLSAGMTSGSTYNLRPENTLGYFSLSGERNYRLTEKSDREGFVDNAAYRGFLAIARTCRDFANDAIVNVRRSLDEYDKELKDAQRSTTSSDDDLSRVGSLAEATTKLSELITSIAHEVSQLGSEKNDNEERKNRVIALTKNAESLSSAAMSGAESPEILVGRIERELNEGRERTIALIESAAAGLASRGLTHELRAHLAEIRHRVTNIERSAGVSREVSAHLTAIRRSCNAIAQAAAQVDPLIPRVREPKNSFSVDSVIRSYFEQRAGILSTVDISVEVTGGDLVVRMSESRLLQAIDNLTRNSIFWLSQLPKGRDRRIDVAVDQRGFIFSDNGPGIDPLVEETLFDLFVTTRQHEQGGQGLGLFISSELLALDGCSISLLPDRNRNRRKYKFFIDLSVVRRGS